MNTKHVERQTPVLREIARQNQARKKEGFMKKSVDERFEELYDMVRRLEFAIKSE